jgi:ABC-2 type transport system ATP-binding protein
VWIQTEGLAKRYGDFTALSEVSLEVRRGEVYGFLGPNGAGKTTTIKILMGILVPSSGVARIQGLRCLEDRVELMRRVGYLPDTPTFYDYLRGREVFRFVGEMHGLAPDLIARRQAELFERMQLTEAADEFVVNYSMGMKKKIALALALLHEPSVLILDEPSTGLDPMAARQIREIIRSSADEGRTVFLSTHLLDMAEKLCDRVGIIHNGRIAAEGTPAELRTALAQDASLEDVFLAVTAADRAQSGM